ncbi:MAG: winged helix-turn-helix domain-containing protein [Acidobacteriia bacterium]|nr:winged helix-turn-helix domain-containing protein [Terriglobia bacterium]
MLRVGELVLDTDALRASIAGEELPLTALEFRLLHFLASHPGRVFRRQQLLDAVWGDTHFVAPRIHSKPGNPSRPRGNPARDAPAAKATSLRAVPKLTEKSPSAHHPLTGAVYLLERSMTRPSDCPAVHREALGYLRIRFHT